MNLIGNRNIKRRTLIYAKRKQLLEAIRYVDLVIPEESSGTKEDRHEEI